MQLYLCQEVAVNLLVAYEPAIAADMLATMTDEARDKHTIDRRAWYEQSYLLKPRKKGTEAGPDLKSLVCFCTLCLGAPPYKLRSTKCQ